MRRLALFLPLLFVGCHCNGDTAIHVADSDHPGWRLVCDAMRSNVAYRATPGYSNAHTYTITRAPELDADCAREAR